jgi:hypothetical protein
VEGATPNRIRDFFNVHGHWAEARDRQLFADAILRRPRGRCYLPETNDPLTTAHQVYWYIDELIVDDPLWWPLVRRYWRPGHFKDGRLVEDARVDDPLSDEEIMALWRELQRPLRKLAKIQHSMESGYVRLINRRISRLDREVNDAGWVGLLSKMDNRRVRERVPDLHLYHGAGPDEPPPPEFVVAESLTVGKILRSTTLFNREVDAAVAFWFLRPREARRNAEIDWSLRVVLPYLRGIRPEHLAEVRAEAPQAFLAFRATILEYTRVVMEETQGDPNEVTEQVKRLVDRDVIPAANALEREMAGLLGKAAFKGYGFAVAGAAGMLAGSLAAAWAG